MWDAVERWLANLLGDEDEPDEGIKHNTSLGGFEETSKEGGNQETRINTSPQIKRLNIDPIITVATVEKPDAAEIYDVNLSVSENIGDITHAIEDLNAANEVNEGKKAKSTYVPKMIFYDYGGGVMSGAPAIPGEDTNGMGAEFQRDIDSAHKAEGY